MKALTKKVLISVAIALLLLGLVLSAALGYIIWHIKTGQVFKEAKFNKTEWLKPVTNDSIGCYKGGMAYDIKKILEEKPFNRKDVFEMLGRPTIINKSQNNIISYDLGYCSGLGMDIDTLDIGFDINNTLVSVSMIQH